ncbi:MAG TPA: kynureninase [Candidatus Limnocylindrales bacterium]|jgi:kynureninase|nr:kynureninase [Candidatus Limnocylindrales bacterium]
MTTIKAAIGEASARALDAGDPLGGLRDRFLLPAGVNGRPKAYLAGMSLGAQPIGAREAVERALDAWARLGVDAWFGDAGWLEADGAVREVTAGIVGARPSEVATLNTLTINLHLLMAAFFRPSGRRTAILIDAPTFPSDRYAVESQLRHHGLDPTVDLVIVGSRDGESSTRVEDLEGAIHEHRDRLALALLAGVNYATGQLHDIERLTAAVHDTGAVAGWDLAHAAGNIPLALHDADVDFAAWCTYKYLNSGPGALGQLFVHERHAAEMAAHRLAGWWGNAEATRFEMADTIDPAPGAAGWRVSTPPILSLAPIAVSLAMFDEVGMTALRERSVALTAYLEMVIESLVPDAEIITPRDPTARGSQLSIRVPDAPGRLALIEALDVAADFREPDIVRMAPVPMYVSYHDAWRAARALADTASRATTRRSPA